MFRLKSALSTVSLAAGVALAVAIFVVSAGALPVRNAESPSEVQYDSEGGAPTGSEGQDPGPGYYPFYDRWRIYARCAMQRGAVGRESRETIAAGWGTEVSGG